VWEKLRKVTKYLEIIAWISKYLIMKKAEGRSKKAEVRRQKAEGRRQK
jgi:hypothetical protein